MVDDPQNPRVTLRRRVPEKNASPGEAPKQPQVSWFPCLTDDSDTETDSVSPPPKQVTTRESVAAAKKEQGPMTGWVKSAKKERGPMTGWAK